MIRKISLGLLTLLALPALTGCAIVEPGYVGVKKSMGVLSKTLLEPGTHGVTPFTDEVEMFSVKQETKEGKATPLTKDQQPITLKFNVQYRLPRGQVLNLYSNINGDPFDALVAPQVQEAFRQVVSQYKADAVIGGLNSIKDQVVALVRQNLRGYVEVVDVPITHIDLPEQLQSSIIEKQQMEIAAKKKGFELDKERLEAEITVTKAKAEAESISLQSKALANSPKLVELRWVEKWDGHMPTTMTGSGGIIVDLKKK